MLKKIGSWIGSVKGYISNVQNEVSSIEDETKSIYENNNTKDIKKENINKNKDV